MAGLGEDSAAEVVVAVAEAVEAAAENLLSAS